LTYVGETGDRWHKRQVGVAFRLCIYCERNNGKVITKYLFYDIGTSPKVLFKSDKYYNKKREKSDSRGGK